MWRFMPLDVFQLPTSPNRLTGNLDILLGCGRVRSKNIVLYNVANVARMPHRRGGCLRHPATAIASNVIRFIRSGTISSTVVFSVSGYCLYCYCMLVPEHGLCGRPVDGTHRSRCHEGPEQR
jgi:hypothetical protein